MSSVFPYHLRIFSRPEVIESERSALKEFEDRDSAKYGWLRLARKCLLSHGRLLKFKWLVATKNNVVM